MTKFDLRNKAIQLRLIGKSYSEINDQIRVSKSSLSLWLRDIPLTDKQVSRLKKKKEISIEKYIKSMKKKRELRLKNYYNNQLMTWTPLSERERYIAGLFLYWGEGDKASRHMISLNNTDPRVVKFAYSWFHNCLGFPKAQIKIQLHLYSDMNIDKEIDYWSNKLDVNRDNFTKPYIKKSKRSDINQKGYGHGTCGVRVNNTIIKENILMCLQAISDYVKAEENEI